MLVLQDAAASVSHLRALYGGRLVADMPQPEWHACFVKIGDVLLELFVPFDFLLNLRHGPYHLGIGYQASPDTVRNAAAAHGVRIARDTGLVVYTHPGDCFGVTFKFYEGSLDDVAWPTPVEDVKLADHRQASDGLNIIGLRGHSLAVFDLEAASAFLGSFLDAKLAYEIDRPSLSARAKGLWVAGSIIELLTPSDEGVISRYLTTTGQGIYAVQFAVADVERAQAHFQARGVPPYLSQKSHRVLIPSEASLGVVFELVQAIPECGGDE